MYVEEITPVWKVEVPISTGTFIFILIKLICNSNPFFTKIQILKVLLNMIIFTPVYNLSCCACVALLIYIFKTTFYFLFI